MPCAPSILVSAEKLASCLYTYLSPMGVPCEPAGPCIRSLHHLLSIIVSAEKLACCLYTYLSPMGVPCEPAGPCIRSLHHLLSIIVSAEKLACCLYTYLSPMGVPSEPAGLCIRLLTNSIECGEKIQCVYMACLAAGFTLQSWRDSLHYAGIK